MSDFTIFCIVYVYTMVLWIVVLVVYSTFVEALDFGYLSSFALKSAILVGGVAAVVTFIPFFGGFLALFVWGIGLMAIFRMDPWEAKMLVFLLWGVNYAAGWAMRFALV